MKSIILIAILTALALGIIALAADTVAPSPSEVQALRLLSAYQHAVIDQQVATASASQFNAIAEQTRIDMHLPEGTTFAIDLAKQHVAVRLPDPPPPAANTPAPTPPPTDKVNPKGESPK